MKKRITSLLLAAMLCLALVVPAAANTPENLYIGSEEDRNATVIVEGPEDGAIAPYANAYLLFAMEATNVSDLVTTRFSNKSFTRADLTLGYLHFAGLVTNSYAVSDALTSRVGACRVGPNGDYVADIVAYFPSGIRYSWSAPKSQLYSGETYYGFIKNNSGLSGTTVSGRVTFDNADF